MGAIIDVSDTCDRGRLRPSFGSNIRQSGRPTRESSRKASDRDLPSGSKRTRQVQRDVVVGATQSGQKVRRRRPSQALKVAASRSLIAAPLDKKVPRRLTGHARIKFALFCGAPNAKYYVFKATSGRHWTEGTALIVTADRTSADLSSQSWGSWKFLRAITLIPGSSDSVIVSHDDAISAIAQEGYYRIPEGRRLAAGRSQLLRWLT